jgi:hypothetical protein
MSLVLKEDFKGEFAISTNRWGAKDLDLYIEKYSKFYLELLFGKTFYDLFIADLDVSVPQVPQTQRFLDVFNEFLADGQCLYRSEGIRQMLVKFIYFHFVRNQPNFNTVTGNVHNNNENSINAFYDYNLVEAHNSACQDYIAIQRFMLRSNDYTEVISTVLNTISGY